MCDYNSNLVWIKPAAFPIDLPLNGFRLILNLSEKDNYNPNLVCINKIPKRFLCLCSRIGIDRLCNHVISKHNEI